MFTLLLFCIWNEFWCINSFGSRLKLSDKPSLSFNYRDLLVNYNTGQVSPIFFINFDSNFFFGDHNLPVKVLKFWTTFFISKLLVTDKKLPIFTSNWTADRSSEFYNVFTKRFPSWKQRCEVKSTIAKNVLDICMKSSHSGHSKSLSNCVRIDGIIYVWDWNERTDLFQCIKSQKCLH